MRCAASPARKTRPCDQVEAHLAEIAPHVTTVVQTEQRGTGHAVQVALEALPALDGDVLVTYGDVPMLTADTLVALVAAVQLQVRVVEEPYLRAVHGAAYDAYAARAGRFLPGIGLLAAPASAERTPA